MTRGNSSKERRIRKAMQLIMEDDYEAMSRSAALLVAEILRQKPAATVVFATGNTPLGCYRELARLARQDGLDVSAVVPFQLDEYVGIPASDPRSLFGWSRHAFLEPLGLAVDRTVRLRGDWPDLEAACRAYDEAVSRAGGFDLAILGLGPNGHLGFNEPPSYASDPTRVVSLTDASLLSNAAYWGEGRVPQRALTCGMNLLLAARQILLLVSGVHKHEILWKTLRGPVTPDVPSSYLQQHSSVIVLADQAAYTGERHDHGLPSRASVREGPGTG
jgi:glucosamine-6-phosphate deaminase